MTGVYRWVDHTAELELHVEASSRAEVFADALAAFAELVGPEEDGGSRARHEISLRADDEAVLLADWLSELVFLAETDDFVPERIIRLELGRTSLRAAVEGRCTRPSPIVKAVTYHGLELIREGDLWRARIVLDV